MNRATLLGLQNSTRCVFFLVGVISALWSCLVPVIKSHAGLDDGGLGLLILCLGTGSVIGMPLAGHWVGRWGCRAITTGGAALAGSLLLPLALLHAIPALALAVFGLGMGLGAIETAMNVQSVEVEKLSQRPMLSGFHAFFSIGGAVGAAGPPLLATFHAQPWLAIAIGQACLASVFLWAWPRLLSQPEPGGASGLALPRGVVWLLGILTGMAFLAEGAVLDWGGVYLAGERGSLGIAPGWGYAVFAAAMTLGRLTGDRLVALCGRFLVMVIGALCAGSGFVLIVSGTLPTILLAGFALIGLGCANIVPVLFTLAGSQTAMRTTAAVAAISTMGYAGILAGPALIGAVAHFSSLAAGFGLLAAMMVFIALNARLAR